MKYNASLRKIQLIGQGDRGYYRSLKSNQDLEDLLIRLSRMPSNLTPRESLRLQGILSNKRVFSAMMIKNEELFEPLCYFLKIQSYTKGSAIVKAGTSGKDIIYLLKGKAGYLAPGNKIAQIKGDTFCITPTDELDEIYFEDTILTISNCIVLKLDILIWKRFLTMNTRNGFKQHINTLLYCSEFLELESMYQATLLYLLSNQFTLQQDEFLITQNEQIPSDAIIMLEGDVSFCRSMSEVVVKNRRRIISEFISNQSSSNNLASDILKITQAPTILGEEGFCSGSVLSSYSVKVMSASATFITVGYPILKELSERNIELLQEIYRSRRDSLFFSFKRKVILSSPRELKLKTQQTYDNISTNPFYRPLMNPVMLLKKEYLQEKKSLHSFLAKSFTMKIGVQKILEGSPFVRIIYPTKKRVNRRSNSLDIRRSTNMYIPPQCNKQQLLIRRSSKSLNKLKSYFKPVSFSKSRSKIRLQQGGSYLGIGSLVESSTIL